jgi:hypothetical protein
MCQLIVLFLKFFDFGFEVAQIFFHFQEFFIKSATFLRIFTNFLAFIFRVLSLSLFEKLRELILFNSRFFIENTLKLWVQLSQLLLSFLYFFTLLQNPLEQDFFPCIHKVALGVIKMVHLAVEAEIAIALLAVSYNLLVTWYVKINEAVSILGFGAERSVSRAFLQCLWYFKW